MRRKVHPRYAVWIGALEAGNTGLAQVEARTRLLR
jgi:hypothetical protein